MEGPGLSKVRLEETAAWLQKGELRLQRIGLALILGMGSFLIVVGVLFETGVWPASSEILNTSVLILFVCGALVIVAAIVGLSYTHIAATELEIGPTGIRLKGSDGREVKADWADSSLDLTIVDRRSVPVERRNTHVKELDFVLRVKGARFDAGIPLGTVKRIMRDAESNGLTVSGWHDEPRTIPRSGFIRIRSTKDHR